MLSTSNASCGAMGVYDRGCRTFFQNVVRIIVEVSRTIKISLKLLKFLTRMYFYLELAYLYSQKDVSFISKA